MKSNYSIFALVSSFILFGSLITGCGGGGNSGSDPIEPVTPEVVKTGNVKYIGYVSENYFNYCDIKIYSVTDNDSTEITYSIQSLDTLARDTCYWRQCKEYAATKKHVLTDEFAKTKVLVANNPALITSENTTYLTMKFTRNTNALPLDGTPINLFTTCSYTIEKSDYKPTVSYGNKLAVIYEVKLTTDKETAESNYVSLLKWFNTEQFQKCITIECDVK